MTLTELMSHIPRHFGPTFDHISDIQFPTFINILITFDHIPAPPPTINPILNNIVSNMTIYNITIHHIIFHYITSQLLKLQYIMDANIFMMLLPNFPNAFSTLCQQLHVWAMHLKS